MNTWWKGNNYEKSKSKTQTDCLPYENLLTVVLSVGQTHTHDGINGSCFTRWIVHFIDYTIGTGGLLNTIFNIKALLFGVSMAETFNNRNNDWWHGNSPCV